MSVLQQNYMWSHIYYKITYQFDNLTIYLNQVKTGDECWCTYVANVLLLYKSDTLAIKRTVNTIHNTVKEKYSNKIKSWWNISQSERRFSRVTEYKTCIWVHDLLSKYVSTRHNYIDAYYKQKVHAKNVTNEVCGI